MLEWDEKKRNSNRAKHGVDFATLYEADWERMVVQEDSRRAYGELRLQLTLPIHGRLYIGVITKREARLRVISLRKANAKEVSVYDKQTRKTNG